MAYDASSATIVLFGGFHIAELGDTWSWNGTTWSKLAPATSPTARNSASMAFDASTSTALLFGGSGATPPRLLTPWTLRYIPSQTGPPTAGLYTLGTAFLDSNDVLWICTAGGSPGTWVKAAEGGDSGWIDVSGGVGFQNGWFQSLQDVAYRKQGNVVRIRGGVTGGTAGSTVFTLPAGFRPSQNYTTALYNATAGGVGYCIVATTGAVSLQLKDQFYFDPISFTVD